MIFEAATGMLVAIGVYLIIEQNIIRKMFGIVTLSTAINLIILFCGRLSKTGPALIGTGPLEKMSNPLPQALILTAIVIGFGLLAFMTMLVRQLLLAQRRKQGAD